MEEFFLPELILQVRGLTQGRIASLIPAVLALSSVVMGIMAVRSSARIKSGKRKANVTLIVALLSICLSGLHLASTTGGFGTGSGRLGALVALALGLIGIVLAVLAYIRMS